MALPKQGTRQIIVDSASYRWGVYSKTPFLTVRVELMDEPGQQLIAKFSSHVASNSSPSDAGKQERRAITPELVKRIIQVALERGWQPDQRKPAEFPLSDADALFPTNLHTERKLRRGLVITARDVVGRRIHDTVNRALQELGIRTYDLRDFPAGASLTNAITAAIREADFVVADVTRQNPNVLYEIGYANALEKPTILLVDGSTEEELPSDLAGLSYLTYDLKNLRSLQEYIGRAVRRTIDREGKL
jgi:TIR domain